MSDWSWLSLSFVFGVCLGAVYLTILWFTLKRLQQNKHTAIWLPISLILRMTIMLSGLYYIMGDGHWERILLALSGYIAMRVLSVRFIQAQISVLKDHQGKAA